MTTPQPQGLPPLREIKPAFDHPEHHMKWTRSEIKWIKEYATDYASEALRGQAATLESIHQILQCAGPDAAGEIADLLGYPSVEWPSDQAASVPVAYMTEDGRVSMRTTVETAMPRVARESFTIPLYAGAPPSPASVQNASLVEKLAKRTCEANADAARFTIALQTLRASLDPDDWMGAVTMHNYIDAVLAGGSPLQQHPAPSPAQAVMQVGCENIDGTLNIHPETETCSICEPAQAVDAGDELREALKGLLASGGVIADASPDELQAALSDPESEPIVKTQAAAVLRARAALQASSQPQAQQGGGENTARAFIEWCKAQPEDRVPVSIDEALNEFEAALATKEPK